MIYRVHLYGLKNSKHFNNHNILDNVPDSNSLAGYILLKSMLMRQDSFHVAKMQPVRDWLRFRNKLLRRIKKRNKGVLVCHYCKRAYLKSNHNSRTATVDNSATLDHVYPLSKGGKRFDESNLVVACLPCNSKKADKIID